MPEPRRRWYQFSLRTMFVAVAVVAIFIAMFGASAIAVAGLAGIEIAVLMTTVTLIRFADRLEKRGHKYASVAVGLVAPLPLLLGLIVLFAALLVLSLSGHSGSGY